MFIVYSVRLVEGIFLCLKQLKDELGEVVAELEALDGQEECKQNSKAKQMSIGRKKFNMDPKKGT